MKLTLAIMGLVVSSSVSATELSVAIGRGDYGQGPNGDWHYKALPWRSERDVTIGRLSVDREWKNIRARVSYNDFGEASMVAQNVGDENLGCYPVCVERSVDYATTRTKSFSAEIIPSIKYKKWTVYASLGAQAFRTHTEVTHYNGKNLVDTNNGLNDGGAPRIDAWDRYEFTKSGIAGFYGAGISYRSIYFEGYRFGRTQPSDSPFTQLHAVYLGMRVKF